MYRIFGLILLVVLTGCTPSPTTVDQRSSERSGFVGNVEKFTFEEHNIIMFSHSLTREPAGVVHDPNCKKCKNKEEE